MSTALVNLFAGIGARLLDKKKPLGKTNVSTLAAIGSGSGAAYIFMLQSPDIIIQVMGFVLTLATLALAAYKESRSDCTGKQ